MTLVEYARKLRPLIEKAANSLDDKTASTAPELFRTMKFDGALIPAGQRINWNGVIMQAMSGLWDRPENSPDNAPVLWKMIDYRDGIRNIPEVIPAGLAFDKGELGWWKNEKYKSLRPGNVWTPDGHPAAWEKQKG